MFLESQIDHNIQKGSIEVICGSMFSGKTEELLRRLKRAEFAKLKTAVFKPQVDIRYDNKKVVSHDSNIILSTPVNSPSEILNLVDFLDVTEKFPYDDNRVDYVFSEHMIEHIS